MIEFFVRRPILSSVMSLLIVLFGLLALKSLPVAQYPEITPPQVTISTSYPGANAETLMKTVAAPIEEQLDGLEGLLYYSSNSSSDGSVSISVSFEVGTPIDLATIKVNNQVSIAEPRLPDQVRQAGILVQKKSNDILQVVSLIALDANIDTLALSNYASLNILNSLKNLPGVGGVSIFGARDYSMRIWLDPIKLTQYGLVPDDIAAAIQSQNSQQPLGKIGNSPNSSKQALVYSIVNKGRLVSEEEFSNIIIKASSQNGVLKLKDVSKVELGAQNYNSFTELNGQPAVGIAIFLQSGANALKTAEACEAKLLSLKGNFPAGIDYKIPFDTTRFVRASITEVILTLIEAIALVVVVVLVFLKSLRATLIPLIVVPIALLGSLAGLYLFGFSINTLTLFAMVLSIGIIVDDAIIVIENVERLIKHEKMQALPAVIAALKEVAGPIVAIVMVLCSVFLPLAFLGGITGRLYQQFALTLSVAIIISGFVALTLTPALCVLVFKNQHDSKINAFFAYFDQKFEKFSEFYMYLVQLSFKFKTISYAIYLAVVISAVALFSLTPGSFVPEEDQGYLVSSLILPANASLNRTDLLNKQLLSDIKPIAGIENVFSVMGMDAISGATGSNSGTLFIPLLDWKKRSAPANLIAKQIQGKGMQLPSGLALVFNPPAIRGLGSAGGFEFFLQNRTGDDLVLLSLEINKLISALKANKKIAAVSTFFNNEVPQIMLELDTQKTLQYGVAIKDVYSALSGTIGSRYINDFNYSGKTFQVQIQAESEFRSTPNDIPNINVRAASGAMVPLSSLIKLRYISGCELIQRYNGFMSAKLMGSASPGVSAIDSIEIIEATAKEVLSPGFTIDWTGQSLQEKKMGHDAIIAMALAGIMVFLILSALYEDFSKPLAVLATIPYALWGAILATFTRGYENNIYFQIGLVVLIGLAAKNAILIVEFAAQKCAAGKTPQVAAIEAAAQRFRPIIMTSLAFILGVVPLYLADGAGSAARRSMGTSVLGGMLTATIIGTIFIPLLFCLFVKDKPNATTN